MGSHMSCSALNQTPPKTEESDPFYRTPNAQYAKTNQMKLTLNPTL